MLDIGSSEKVTGEFVPVPIDRRSLVQKANLLVILAVSSLSFVKWLVVGSDFLPIPGMIITLLGACNGIYLALGGTAIVAARCLIAILVLGMGFASFDSGGFDGPIVLLAPLIPVLSFLLIGARAGWVAALAVVFGLLVILLLHFIDAVPPSPHTESNLRFARFVALAVTGVIATWVIWTFAVTANELGHHNKVLANTDHLTGIANRRSSEHFLEQEILRAQRSGHYLSLIIADVDFFKRYNDLNGHQAGDKCLQRVAAVMKYATRRPADMVGRLGGEEFLAVLPDTNPEGALAVAERMRQGILDDCMPYEPGNQEMLSLTLGVTSFPGREIDSASGMIRLADQALYQGKKEGRNRVVMNMPAASEQASVIVADINRR